MSRPAEKVKPWFEYRNIFLTPRRISAGVDFFREHEAALRQISAEHRRARRRSSSAILGVETFYGTRTGSYRAVDALATLAFDYPPRSTFFRSELRQLFLLAREEQLDIGGAHRLLRRRARPAPVHPEQLPQLRGGRQRRWPAGPAERTGTTSWRASPTTSPGTTGSPASPSPPARNWPGMPPDRPGPRNSCSRTRSASLARQGVQFTTDLPATAPAHAGHPAGRGRR